MTGHSVEHPSQSVPFTEQELADYAALAEPGDAPARELPVVDPPHPAGPRSESGIRVWRARGDLFVRHPDGTQEQWRYTAKVADPVMMRRVGKRR